VKAPRKSAWRFHSFIAMSDEENPKKGILEKLLSEGGDSTVKLITLALVVVSGGGNLLATKQTANDTDKELDRAIKEVHEIRAVIDDSIARQKEILEALKKRP
jgi:hypothetical protein